MLKPSGGALKKLFAPGRVKSDMEAPSRPAMAKSNNHAMAKKPAGLFGKARKTA